MNRFPTHASVACRRRSLARATATLPICSRASTTRAAQPTPTAFSPARRGELIPGWSRRSPPRVSHVIVWEFRVRAGCEREFEEAYGPGGAWAQLFAASPDCLGTELLRDEADHRRYLTVDRWGST